MNNTGNEKFKRVDKKVARKHWSKGGTVYLLPCQMRLESHFSVPCSISSNKNSPASQFDVSVKMYEYYNCNSEVGKYVSFYIAI